MIERYYMGVAQVQPKHLLYDVDHSEPDECTGCCLSDPVHHIPALIGPSDLDTALRKANKSLANLHEIGQHPQLALPSSLKLLCLHGRRRLEAASPGSDEQSEWWVVDLFQAEIPNRVGREIRKRYNQHLPRTDGEIYLHIRYYQRIKSVSDTSRWMRLLSPSKQAIMNQIRGLEWLAEDLDNLGPFRFLWSGFKLGPFPPILSWRCYDEIHFYLASMAALWRSITDGNNECCDEETVLHLQGLAPSWCVIDGKQIEDLARRKKIFQRARNNATCQQLVENVLKSKGPVLSFGTFFKDTKVIGHIMLDLRELFAPFKIRPTMYRMFQENYKMPTASGAKMLFQHGETEEKWDTCSGEQRFSCAYWQLCLFVLRHHLRERKKIHHHSATKRKRDPLSEFPGWLIRLGCLAHALGFESDRILELCQQDADLCDIRRHMQRERPSELFSISTESFHCEATTRKERQVMLFATRNVRVRPEMSNAISDGSAQAKTHLSLFLPLIWQASRQERKKHLTGFGRMVLLLSSFFEGFLSADTEKSIPSKVSSLLESESTGTTPTTVIAGLVHDEQQEYPIRPPSSIYSGPLTLYDRSDSSHAILRFWHLPSQTGALCIDCRCCKPSEVQDLLEEISGGARKTFFLAAVDGKLKVFDETRLISQTYTGNFFYIYSDEPLYLWVNHPPPKLEPWLNQPNPWTES